VTTPLRRYYRGHTLATMRDESANQSRCYHFDHQGTTQCLTDSTGAVTDRFASDAWGTQRKRTGNSANRQWYIGDGGYYRHVDEPVDYARARVLGNTQGGWISRDPMRLTRAHGSRYSYVHNRPSRFRDPSGLIPCRNRRIGPIIRVRYRHDEVQPIQAVGEEVQLGPYVYFVARARIICDRGPCEKCEDVDPGDVKWCQVYTMTWTGGGLTLVDVPYPRWCPDTPANQPQPVFTADKCKDRNPVYRGTQRPPYLWRQSATECVFLTCMMDLPGLVTERPMNVVEQDCTVPNPKAVLDPLKLSKVLLPTRYGRYFQTFLCNSQGTPLTGRAVYWGHGYYAEDNPLSEQHIIYPWMEGLVTYVP
jgi:RHS repeat-associated protein